MLLQKTAKFFTVPIAVQQKELLLKILLASTIGTKPYNPAKDHAKCVNHKQNEKISMGSYERRALFTIPSIDGLSPVYFLFCSLKDKGTVVSRNCYWLPTSKDIFTKTAKQLFYWPVKLHADLRALRSLSRATVKSSYDIKETADGYEIEVTLSNVSEVLAFFVKTNIVNKENGESIVPVYWSDNCISLMPSEQVTIIGILPKNKDIAVEVDGWNI